MSESVKLKALTAVALLGTGLLSAPLVTSPAMAMSLGTKLACRADYRSYCGSFKVGSADLRKCMNDHGAHLSKKCVDALIADGEISKEEVARRAASQQ